MSIVLVEKGGRLAQTQEATLRLCMNRANRQFWREAAHIPLSRWPAFRDNELAGIFAGLAWMDIWSMPDGDHVVRQGIGSTIAHKTGDVIAFIDRSGSGRLYDMGKWWGRGEPCPYAYTLPELQDIWDAHAQAARIERLDAICLDRDHRHEWPDERRADAAAILDMAERQQWQEAAAFARAVCQRDRARKDPDFGMVSAQRYLDELTSGAST